MSVWFTSDLHIGHRLVAALRGYGTKEEPDVAAHDAAIFKAWSKVVGPGDQVWVLGDVTLAAGSAKLASILDRIAELPGDKHLVAGNHDPCHPMHRESHKFQRLYLGTFASVQPFARRRVAGEDVLLSHFPYDADRGDVRYAQYRLPNEGKWLLHGHLHSGRQRTGTREIHVGVDAWALAPVPLYAIEREIQKDPLDCFSG